MDEDLDQIIGFLNEKDDGSKEPNSASQLQDKKSQRANLQEGKPPLPQGSHKI